MENAERPGTETTIWTRLGAAVRAKAMSLGGESDAGGPPDGIGKRLLKPQTLVSFGFAALIVVFLVTRLDINFHAVWRNVKDANPWLYALAFSLYYANFVLRAVRWRWMLKQAGISQENGYPVPGIP